MMWKQHRGFKNRLLAVLFLFFNCVCAAAPVAKLNDDFKGAISLKLSGPLESEEETHVAAGYISHISHLSVAKKLCKQNQRFSNSNYPVSISSVESSNIYLSNSSTLPLPGTYAFLFRYNLF